MLTPRGRISKTYDTHVCTMHMLRVRDTRGWRKSRGACRNSTLAYAFLQSNIARFHIITYATADILGNARAASAPERCSARIIAAEEERSTDIPDFTAVDS